MKILLIGANGRMGQAMQKVMAQKGIEFFGVDKDNRLNAKSVDCDVIVDFSSADALEDNLSSSLRRDMVKKICNLFKKQKMKLLFFFRQTLACCLTLC